MRKIAIWDFDVIKYNIGFACEKRTIVVQHPSGIEQEFSNRTEFYGHYSKKDGGWLSKYNENKKEPLLAEEFTITDKQVLKGPIENCFHSVKAHIADKCKKAGCDEYFGFIGRGDSFRVELSTILKYKGNRAGMLKPLLLPDIEEYLLKHHDTQVVEGIECDDAVVIECYKQPNKVLMCVDKDFDGVNHLTIFNTMHDKMYFTGAGLGSLWKDDKNKVRGLGRKFFYHQILSEDSSDNYCANSASDVKWGEKSSFNLLDPCKTDKECLEAIVEGYKILYPEKKIVKGWRGNDIEVDWLYAASENWNLARMLRWVGDEISFEDTLKKVGVEYGS